MALKQKDMGTGYSAWTNMIVIDSATGTVTRICWRLSMRMMVGFVMRSRTGGSLGSLRTAMMWLRLVADLMLSSGSCCRFGCDRCDWSKLMVL